MGLVSLDVVFLLLGKKFLCGDLIKFEWFLGWFSFVFKYGYRLVIARGGTKELNLNILISYLVVLIILDIFRGYIIVYWNDIIYIDICLFFMINTITSFIFLVYRDII